jgi:hypothetical protein
MAIAQDWHELVDDDLETHPTDGALIEVEYENGGRAQASFSQGIISLLSASAEIAGGTHPKRWRYLRRP